jgi:hypothetical protein
MMLRAVDLAFTPFNLYYPKKDRKAYAFEVRKLTVSLHCSAI